MALALSNADLKAIQDYNSNYLLDKGANYYLAEDYALAVEYYHLAAALGNMQAISNLGYCYLYGRSVEKNESIAMAYFQLSADAGNIDSLYKLGEIYEKGKGVNRDPEFAVFYYSKAINEIKNSDHHHIYDYPSVFLAVAQARMPGGLLPTNLENAYEYLLIAREGYELGIHNGMHYWQAALDKTEELLTMPLFEHITEGDDEDEEWDEF